MTARPHVDPALLARLLELLPARLRKRFDAEPELGAAWIWTAVEPRWQIQCDGETVVQLKPREGVIDDLSHVTCTCLLAPRCLHVAASLACLKPATSTLPASASAPTAPRDLPAANQNLLDEAAVLAATSALDAAGVLLASGVHAAGAATQSRLLLALHHARVSGCPRLAAALGRTLGGVRLLRERTSTDASLSELASDLTDAAGTALRMVACGAAGIPPEGLLGHARRPYYPVGNLQLTGLCSEAVITRGGYAGVITWLIDQQSRCWSLAAMRPGGASGVRQAWDGGVGLGDLSCSHRELSRGGCLVQHATASADGRLGAGREVLAVSLPGSNWETSPIATLFARPLAEQVERAFAGWSADHPAPAGDLLITVRGRLCGTDGQALILELDERHRLRIEPAAWHDSLAYVDNLRRLGHAHGAVVAVVGRLVAERAGTIAALAIGSAHDSSLRLPAEFSGRCQLGLEQLPGAGLPTTRDPSALPPAAPDPWSGLQRQLERVLSGGRGAGALSEKNGSKNGDAEALEQLVAPHGAYLLRSVRAACTHTTTDTWGRHIYPPLTMLAQQWVAAALYDRAAKRHYAHARWREACRE